MSSRFQTMLSLTLPTSTGPEVGSKVPSVAVLNTLRAELTPRLVFEGGFGLGLTPTHGPLADRQHVAMLSFSSGLRKRIWGRQSLFANLFYHSPVLSRYDLAGAGPPGAVAGFRLDCWPRGAGGSGGWGMTEDLEPGGPGVDLVFRFGEDF